MQLFSSIRKIRNSNVYVILYEELQSRKITLFSNIVHAFELFYLQTPAVTLPPSLMEVKPGFLMCSSHDDENTIRTQYLLLRFYLYENMSILFH